MYGKVLICDPVDSIMIDNLQDKFEIDYKPAFSPIIMAFEFVSALILISGTTPILLNVLTL